MKNNKHYVFTTICKGQVIFCLICLILVLSTSIFLDVTNTSQAVNTEDRLDFCIVIDAGHGGFDVK